MTAPGITKGTVLEIQRMSTEDGPGLRTSVFLKGCSLECKWCHNPESISYKQDIQWRHNNCIGCQICVNSFPEGAFQFYHGKLFIDRRMEIDYEQAVKECPSGALELIGQTWNADSLVAEILKDKAYFSQTNNGESGGVTISGGEPVMQTDFVADVFQKLQGEGVHTTLDTCGMYTSNKLEKILPHVNLVLFDMKEIDPQKHKDFTGSINKTIFDNLKFIHDYVQKHDNIKLWIRTPIIPETTDTEENISGIAQFLAENNIEFERWELCAFNNLCNDKYERLGMEWEYKNNGLLTKAFMDNLLKTAQASSHLPQRVIWTGSVKSPKVNAYEIEDNNQIKAVNYCKITAIPT